MMRRLTMVLLVVTGLLLGAVLALAVNGRMAHLRALDAALPGVATLPGWSAVIDDSAGILRGSAQLGMPALGWQLQSIGLEGPVWHFRLEGPGLTIEAPAVLARADAGEGGPVLALSPVTGHIDSIILAEQSAMLSAWPQAQLQPTRGRLRLDMHSGRLTLLEIEGLARDVIVDGAMLGSGRFNLSDGPDEELRLVARLSGFDNGEHAGFDAELRVDRSAGVAVLALVPRAPEQMPQDQPTEGMLRALPLPAGLVLPDTAR